MYKTVDFEVIPLKQIIADLKDASGYNPYTERVFLVGGEPLCLPFEQMKEILTQIKKYLPYCACVSMYASIKNLRDKTVEQLKELHRLGLGFLYIGLESGSDRILKQMKLVKNRREGKTVFYSLADGHIKTIINQGMEHIQE